MENSIFRSALNGFNRQDVMSYIERTQKEAGEKTSALEEKLEKLQTSGVEAEAALAECKGELEKKEQTISELAGRFRETEDELKRKTVLLDGADRELAAAREEIRRLSLERDALNAKNHSLEDELLARSREKEQVAELELEARSRCDALLDEAQQNALRVGNEAAETARETLASAEREAESILQEARERIDGLTETCNAFFGDMDTVATHITGELRRMDVAMSQLPLSCDRLRKDLKELRELAGEDEQ